MAAAAIVAGGIGSRMGNTALPKQFLELCGKPVIIHTIEGFLKHPNIEYVIVGINPDWHDYMQKLAEKYFSSSVYITDGGMDRNGTIENIIRFAKASLSASDDDILLTHDAVRPFVTEKMISDSIAAMNECEICTAAIPATDTIIVSEDGQTADSFPLRKTIYQVQTPQTFRLGSFMKMLSSLNVEERAAATDACRLFHDNGKEVRLIEGSASNIKITYPTDLKAACALIEQAQQT